ncbi:MAG: hypothetical protein MK240_09960 [Opitutales bacterium]|nr:hypothetical protein [Opitutales bacterium]
MMNTKRVKQAILGLSIAALGILIAGCSQSGIDVGSNAETSEKLNAYILGESPGEAITVSQARESAKPGGAIVVSGRIGASHKPFGGGFATLVLGDESLQYCNEIPGDACETPWDACCEDRPKIIANRASVQLLADGFPIAESLKGAGGLTELDQIVVVGFVDLSSTSDNLIINASGIYRESN